MKVWFDAEADYLEVQFREGAGYMKETAHDHCGFAEETLTEIINTGRKETISDLKRIESIGSTSASPQTPLMYFQISSFFALSLVPTTLLGELVSALGGAKSIVHGSW